MRKRSLCLLAIVIACFASSSAFATLNIYDPFNYTAGQPLQGQVNNSGMGTANGNTWLRAGTANPPSAINVVSGSLDGGPDARPSIGNSVSITGIGNGAGATNRLALGQQYTTGTVYYSFLLRVDALTGSDNNIGGQFFSFNNTGNSSQTGNPSVMPARAYTRIDPNDSSKFSLAIVNNRQTTNVITQSDPAWFDGLTVGDTLYVVGSYDITNAISRMWINPGLGLGLAPTADRTDTTAGNTFSSGIQSVLLRQSAAPYLTMDELRVGNTWADVTPALASYWDIDGATAGAGGATPSGAWDGSTANWSDSAAGDVATQAWVPGSNAVFSAGSDATGAYTVTISGTQSAASVTFEDGTVTLTGGTLSLTGARRLVANTGVTATVASEIAGSSGLRKDGIGTVVLTGSNSYNGATTIAEGTLQLGDGGTTGTLPTASAITVNSTLSVNRSNNVTQGTDFSGNPISGTGGITQAGSGTLTLNAANTFSGTTRAGAGTLLLTNSLALQNSTLNLDGADTGAVVFDNSLSAATVGGLAGSRNRVLENGASSALALSLGDRTASYSGVLSGSGSLTKIGTGTQTLSGANTYTGGTTINGGALQFAKTFAMPSAPVPNGVTVNSGGTLAVNAGGTDEWTDGTSGVGTIGGLIAGSGGQTGTANQVTWMAGSTLGIDTTNAPGAPSAPDLTYAGAIGNFRTTGGGTTDAVGFTKQGAGTLTLSASAHTFSGPLSTAASGGTLVLNGTALSAGTSQAIPTVSVGSNSNLQLGASDRLPAGSLITTQSQGRFQLMGFHQTVRSLSGTNGFVEVGAGRLDIVDQAGDDYTYGNGTGTATIVTSDSVWNPDQGTVYKSGAGTLTLKTPSTAFNGTFIMESGTLRLSHSQIFGTTAGTGRLIVKGGQLARNDTPTGNFTYQVSAVDLHVLRYDLSDDAARTSQFSANTVTTLKEDEVEINITNTGVQTGTSGRFNFPGVIRNHNPIQPGEDLNAIRGIKKTGNGVLALIGDAAHPNTYLGPTTIEDGVLLTSFISTIGDYNQATIAPINLKGGILASADRRVDPNTSVSYPIKNPINVDGNGTIAFFGNGSQTAGVLMELDNNTIVGTSGTLTIANLNSHTSASSTFQPRFTGNGFNFGLPITISGAVTVGTGVKTSELQGGNTTGTQTFSGPISGGGSLRRVNAGGETILSGANTHIGGTFVEAGTLTASGSSATFGSGNVTVTGGMLSIASGVTNAIANAATLSVNSPGIVDLGAGINEFLAALVLDGNSQAFGTYGSSASSATFQLDQYFSGTGILTVAAPGLPGDFNSDGKVDAGDYVTWRKNDGTNNALANDNGLGTPVGAAHYNLWRANFGNPPGAGSGGGGLDGTMGVPEPGSLLLLICGVGAALTSSRWRRR